MAEREPSVGTADGAAAASVAPLLPVWQDCGTHRYYLHGDVLFWQMRGPFLESDCVVLFAQRALLASRHACSFTLFDVRQHGGVPPETRRYLVNNQPAQPPRGGVVVFGAGLFIRASLSLILAAIRRLGRDLKSAPTFVDSEAAAWAHLTRERQRLRAAAERAG